MRAGWSESTEWAEGLRRTVQWYQEHGLSGWWDAEAVEASLEAHPSYYMSQAAAGGEPGGFGTEAAGLQDPKARLC